MPQIVPQISSFFLEEYPCLSCYEDTICYSIHRELTLKRGTTTEAETIYLHNSPLLHHADGVYKVNGDSMEPTFHDGDMVLVEHIPDGNALRYGEIGASFAFH